MTEEEIAREISENYYDADGFQRGVNIWLVSPEKLAAFLAKHLPALHAPEVKDANIN